jgi:predicted Zn-dependent peptidase
MLEVIRRRNDSPEGIRGREFMRLLYGKMHPLARIPQVETINNISRGDLAAFHRQYFHPNNIMLAVTGDFKPQDMLRKLNGVFQDWQSGDVSFPEVTAVKYELSPSVHLIHKDIEQTSIAIGHFGIKADNPDYPAIRLLDLILGSGGFSTRLYQEVRNKRGLAYSVGSYLGAGIRDYGAFLIFCGTRNDAAHEAIAIILEEIRKLTETGVTEDELEAAKNQYLNSFVFRFATVSDIVNRKMFYQYIGYPPDFLEAFRDNVMKVTAADVLRVAKMYLHPDKMLILTVGDRSEIAESLATFGQVQTVELEPVE